MLPYHSQEQKSNHQDGCIERCKDKKANKGKALINALNALLLLTQSFEGATRLIGDAFRVDMHS